MSVYLMNIICVVLVSCGLLILLSIVFRYWSRERKMKRVCPLFRQSSYCSGENSIQKDDYLKRLGALFDYNSELIAHVIRNHPNDLWNWMEGDPDYQILCEDNSIERNMLCRYLSMLEVCSLFQIHGFITHSMFWADYEYRLREILSCNDLCSYIAREPALCGLKAKLVEAGKRKRQEESEELLPG